MDKSKLASISVISVLGIVILIMSFNRQQPNTAGVESSTPVVSGVSQSNDITQNNDRLSQVENNINQLASQQEAILSSLQALVAAKQQDAKNTTSSMQQLENDVVENNTSAISSVSKEQQRLDEEAKNNEIFANNENAFYNETVDDGWRTNEESKLNTIFESNNMNIDNLECRGSSCRVELAANETKDAANEDMEKFIRAMPNSRGQFKLEKQVDGSLKTIMIFKPASN